MTEHQKPNLRLVYWSDVFTILSVELLPKRHLGMQIWRLNLYCRGRHAVAALHELRVPNQGIPKPGEKIDAALQIGTGRGAKLFHVQSLRAA